MNAPLERLRYHVTGAIQRGEAFAIEELLRADDEAADDIEDARLLADVMVADRSGRRRQAPPRYGDDW